MMLVFAVSFSTLVKSWLMEGPVATLKGWTLAERPAVRTGLIDPWSDATRLTFPLTSDKTRPLGLGRGGAGAERMEVEEGGG